MQTVTLTNCQRCRLLWVADGDEVDCPRCLRATNKGTVLVAGFEVEVGEIVTHGSEIGLLDGLVRKGLDSIRLGERCPHGYLTWRICPTCYEIK